MDQAGGSLAAGHLSCAAKRIEDFSGESLLPDLFAHLNPMTQQRVLATEITLADELRQEGFAVWQN